MTQHSVSVRLLSLVVGYITKSLIHLSCISGTWTRQKDGPKKGALEISFPFQGQPASWPWSFGFPGRWTCRPHFTKKGVDGSIGLASVSNLHGQLVDRFVRLPSTSTLLKT